MPSPNLMQATSLRPTLLASTQLSTTDLTALYTVPADTSVIVKQGILCNTHTGSVTVSLHLVKAGQAPDATNRVLSNLAITAGDTFPLRNYLGDLQLGPGDALHAQASIAAKLNVQISGSIGS